MVKTEECAQQSDFGMSRPTEIQIEHEALGFQDIDYSLVAQLVQVYPVDLCVDVKSSSPLLSEMSIAVLASSHGTSQYCTQATKISNAQAFGASLLLFYSNDSNYEYDGNFPLKNDLVILGSFRH